MKNTRYWANSLQDDAARLLWFRCLHNAVNIIYVHNQQKFTNSTKCIEKQYLFGYSINQGSKNISRNNFFYINCDRHLNQTQDVVLEVDT